MEAVELQKNLDINLQNKANKKKIDALIKISEYKYGLLDFLNFNDINNFKISFKENIQNENILRMTSIFKKIQIINFTEIKFNSYKKLCSSIQVPYIQTQPLISKKGLILHNGYGNSYINLSKYKDFNNSFFTKYKTNYPYFDLFHFSKLLDKKAINFGIENSKIIFKKKCSKDMVEALYISPLQNQNIKVILIKNNDGRPNIKVFDDNKKEIIINSFDDLANILYPNCLIKLIIKPRFNSFNSMFDSKYKIEFVCYAILIITETNLYEQ
jgi:hypothetical protein